jgi:hypothetical protein
MAHVPLVISHNGMSALQLNAYYCYNCNYEYAPIGGMKNHHLYRIINDKMYRWSFEETTNVARVWYVGEPGIPGETPNKKLELLKSFEERFPEVTPQNVEEKLRLVLVFS